MDELKDMVNDMSSFGTKLSGLSFVTKAMMKLQTLARTQSEKKSKKIT